MHFLLRHLQSHVEKFPTPMDFTTNITDLQANLKHEKFLSMLLTKFKDFLFHKTQLIQKLLTLLRTSLSYEKDY